MYVCIIQKKKKKTPLSINLTFMTAASPFFFFFFFVQTHVAMMNSFPPAPPLDRVTTYDSFLNERERNWKIVVPNWLGYTLSRGLVWLHSRGLEKSVACYTVSIPIHSYSNSHVFYIALGKFVVENNNEILPTGTMYVLCTYSSCLSLSLLNQK